MPWPSKNPADYRTPGRWEGRPLPTLPRWLRWLDADSPWWLGILITLPLLGVVIHRLVEPGGDDTIAWLYLVLAVAWIARALQDRRKQKRNRPLRRAAR